MATFNNTPITTDSFEDDKYYIQQNGRAKVQERSSLVSGIVTDPTFIQYKWDSWSANVNYSIGQEVVYEGVRYIALAASGPSHGGPVQPDTPNIAWKRSVNSVMLTGFKLKENTELPIFTFDGSLLKTQQKFTLFINNELMTFNEDENVQVPALSSAHDYKIYALADGSITAQAWEEAEPSDSILVGGFHAAYSNGAIVERSIWDFGWRPKCSPRAMVLSLSNRVWADIYLMDTAYGLNGYSRPNVQITDGASLPIRPLIYGGNGASTYTSFTQYVAKELAASAAKRLPSIADFEDIAYGTVTGQAAGVDPVTTKYQAGLRSAIGCEQVTGAMWQCGSEVWDRGNGSTGYSWYAADTDNKGQVFSAGDQAVGAVLLGAGWDSSGSAGARASIWNNEPWNSSSLVGARGLCDHTTGGF